MNSKCFSIPFHSHSVSLLGRIIVISFLCVVPGCSMPLKMDDGMEFCILLFFHLTYLGDLIGHILSKERCKCGNVGLPYVMKLFFISKDNLQNILCLLQTALRFVLPPVAITPFCLCSWYTSFLPVPRKGQALHNLCLHFLFSALDICPWQFAWVTPHFSGFSLNVNSWERPCIPFSL